MDVPKEHLFIFLSCIIFSRIRLCVSYFCCRRYYCYFPFGIDIINHKPFIALFSLFFPRHLFAMQTSVKLDILSLNVRRIRDQIRRRSVF